MMKTMDKFSPLFNARSVALAGASNDERKWGFVTLKHLIDGGFSGHVYPVNPGVDEILGLKAYRSIADCRRRRIWLWL